MNIHNRFRTIYFARVIIYLVLTRQLFIDPSLCSRGNLSSSILTEQILISLLLDGNIRNASRSSFSNDGQNLLSREVLMPKTEDWWYIYSVICAVHFAHSSQIWTSSRRRAHHTAWPFLAESKNLPSQHAIPAHLTTGATGVATPQSSGGGSSLRVKVIEKTQMSEINPGVWDGLTPDQARKYYSDEWDRFVKDPYAFRAPRAESYHDLCGKPSKPSYGTIF